MISRNRYRVWAVALLFLFIGCVNTGFLVNENQKIDYLSSIEAIYLEINVIKGGPEEDQKQLRSIEKMKEWYILVAKRALKHLRCRWNATDPDGCDTRIVVDSRVTPVCANYLGVYGGRICSGATVSGSIILLVNAKKIYQSSFHGFQAPPDKISGVGTRWVPALEESEYKEILDSLVSEINGAS